MAIIDIEMEKFKKPRNLINNSETGRGINMQRRMRADPGSCCLYVRLNEEAQEIKNDVIFYHILSQLDAIHGSALMLTDEEYPKAGCYLHPHQNLSLELI